MSALFPDFETTKNALRGCDGGIDYVKLSIPSVSVPCKRYDQGLRLLLFARARVELVPDDCAHREIERGTACDGTVVSVYSG